jgi:hypothetical protein
MPCERITLWLIRCEALAGALGYDQFDEAGWRCTISRAQYGRRALVFAALLPVPCGPGDSPVVSGHHQRQRPDHRRHLAARLVLPGSGCGLELTQFLEGACVRLQSAYDHLPLVVSATLVCGYASQRSRWPAGHPMFKAMVALYAAHIAALAVAFIAAHHQRPDLINSRLKVLTFVNSRRIYERVS